MSAGPGGPPLFVELCAGTAALSLRLHRDGAKPPVSRMGAKTGYANAILRILGLAPGQRAAAYLWCEPDPGVRLLLHAYRDAGLARAAAAIIRGWAAEDPRALWERLRAEGPPRLPEGAVDAGEVARHLCGAYLSYGQRPGTGFRATAGGAWPDTPPDVTTQAERLEVLPSALPAAIAPDARLIDPREVARFAQIVASNRLINVAWSDAEGRWANTGSGGTTFGGAEFATPPERTAEGLDAAPSDLPAVVAADARAVDPREVARWAFVQRVTGRGVQWGGTLDLNGNGGCDPRTLQRFPFSLNKNTIPIDAHEPLPALIHPDARDIDPPALPPGTVCYMDPPYVNTTGYGHDLGRAEVVALARRWAGAGATVAISELVAEGWHAVRIDGERVGQKRTFSKQQAEWLTLNRSPAWVPPVQGTLFGGDR